MRKIFSCAAAILTIGLAVLSVPVLATSHQPAATAKAWLPIWAFRAAVDTPAAGTEPTADTAA